METRFCSGLQLEKVKENSSFDEAMTDLINFFGNAGLTGPTNFTMEALKKDLMLPILKLFVTLLEKSLLMLERGTEKTSGMLWRLLTRLHQGNRSYNIS